ncbi:hypothetical protein [Paractinoplanes rishiriensis]|uniref:Uncharacterized protein n=1 Tax=Paractinoplanes rishiriensis TaxID=1050105 RepID=A0A919K553_9ACTN|nr:hypothetical protein [Actinoplanes rishiriensis]GIF01087.1 hypothetical protein Ari01nite_85510 [Actinoplanes rishiriensis]
MGYTHCWRYQPHSGAYAAAWPAIVQDTTAIIAAVTTHVAIAGPDAAGVPRLSPADGISFNGGPGRNGEAFTLAAPGPTGRQWCFCKTLALPYDLAVTATLLRCQLLLPNTFWIASDGDWDQQWRPARQLIRGLFGAAPTASPFSGAALPTAADYRYLATRTDPD